jgi:hypothetical protein
MWNAAVTDELVALEKRAWVRGAEKFPALRAALDPEQSQGVNQIIQIALDTCELCEQRVFRRIMRFCL